MSLNGEWSLATDPQNVGRAQQWFTSTLQGATPTRVPGIIQETFPKYHGVAWFQRDFVAPSNPHAGGRTLLRFWAVDYLADVWVNGVHVGGHEGGETPFVLDWDYYGQVTPSHHFDGQDTPEDVVAVAFGVGHGSIPAGHGSGVSLGSYGFGEGRFVVNTFRMLEHVDAQPAADRLLLNMVKHGAELVREPLAELPPDFDAQLRMIGYTS